MDQLLLRGREITGVHRADDQSLIAEQILSARREAIGELLGIGDALAIDLVFRGAQHRGELDHRIVVGRTADELVFPPGLAFEIQNAARLGFRIDQAGQCVVGAVGFARERRDREL